MFALLPFSANWVYGEDLANPMFEEANLLSPPLDMVLQDFSDWDAYDKVSETQFDPVSDDDVANAYNSFLVDQFFGCLFGNGTKYYKLQPRRQKIFDEGILKVLEDCNYDPTDKLQLAVKELFVDYELSLADASIGSYPEDTIFEFGPNVLFVKDQRGFQAIPENINSKLEHPAELNHEVVKIDWFGPPPKNFLKFQSGTRFIDVHHNSQPFSFPGADARVWVKQPDGKCRAYYSSAVVSTLSSGAIVKYADTLFDPPLDTALNPYKTIQYVSRQSSLAERERERENNSAVSFVFVSIFCLGEILCRIRTQILE